MSYFDIGNSARELYPAPPASEACHITVLEDYATEGHIPVEAIEKLLAEDPDIDDLAMPGPQPEGFVIYAIKDGKSSVFMTIAK